MDPDFQDVLEGIKPMSYNQRKTLFVSELVEKIENVCVRQDMGRLFAVVYVNKEQRKITTEDILVINGFFPPQIGDRIRLEKVCIEL